MHEKMSSASRSICCACLFITLFFDAGLNRWPRRELVTFAHRAKHNEWMLQYLNDYIELSSTPHPKKKVDHFGLYGFEFPNNYPRARKNSTQNRLNSGPKAGLKTRRHNNILAKYSQLDASNCDDDYDTKQPDIVEEKDWPKFDDIMKLTNKYYDWKNDRWRKYRKKGDNGRVRNNKNHSDEKFKQIDQKHKYTSTKKLNNIKNYSGSFVFKKDNFNVKNEEIPSSASSFVEFVAPVASASQKYKNMRALKLKSLSDNGGRKVSRKIGESPSRKDVKSMKNFHFSRVRMAGKEKSEKVVVAVSANLPPADEDKSRSENSLSSSKRPKINKLNKKQK